MEREKKLNEWTDKLEQQIAVTGDVREEDVEQAFRHITEQADRGLYGKCCYYKAYYYMKRGNSEDSFFYLNEGIRCMVGTEEEIHVSRCYNMLAIIAYSRNNLLLAAEHYNKALDYAAKYQDSNMSNIVGMNLADLYYRLGDYDKAFWWYRESTKPFENGEDDTLNGADNYMTILAGYGFSLAMTGRLKEAEEVCGKLEKMREGKYASRFPVLFAYTFFALLYYREERQEYASACLNVAVQEVFENVNILQNIDCILNLLELLVIMKQYGYLGSILDYLEPLADREGNQGLLLQLLEYQLRYCGSELSEEQYVEKADHFFAIKKEYEDWQNSVVLHMMEMRKQLLKIEADQEELKKKNIRLRYQAEHDELSGLYNKGKLNRYAEEVFDVAMKNRLSLGVLFVDIDEFKQMNDRYGHRAGDACVQAVAECIRSCMPEDFAARYGGDEFVVITLNRGEEYVRECGEKLVQAVKNTPLTEEIGAGVLSVTVGAACAVPTGKNKIWDFMSAADNTLYEQKKEKRGCLRVGSTIGVINGE